MSRHYKDPQLQRIYDHMRGAHANGVNILASGQARGDALSVAYWRGWNGLRRKDGGIPTPSGTATRAAYMAGLDDRRESGRTDVTQHWSHRHA